MARLALLSGRRLPLSLHIRLRALLIPALALALLAGAWWTQRLARDAAAIAYDQALLAAATDVALGLQPDSDGRVRFSLPDEAVQILRSDARDTLFFCVRERNGQAVAGDCDLEAAPVTHAARAQHRSLSRPATYQGQRVNVLTIAVHRQGQPFTVTVAETNHKRQEMARITLLGIAMPVLAVLSIAGVLVWVVIGNALRPLDELEREMRARAATDLSPIAPEHAPDEVRPLVSALNALFGQLSALLESRQRFIADAAHQIRTPLAALQMRLEIALRSSNPDPLDRQSVQRMHASVLRTVRVANQLLALARSEQEIDTLPRQRVDLAALVLDCADEHVRRAIVREIDLGFDLHAVYVHGVPGLLAEVVENLVGNALLYAGRGAVVNVSTGTGPDGRAELRVEDGGAGIAAADRERAFVRFERLSADSQTPEGSGLGLAIVKEIITRHAGTVRLDTSPLGGLAVIVSLPSVGELQPRGAAG